MRSFSSRTEVHQEPAPVVLCEEQVVVCGVCFFCVYLCLIFGRDCAGVLHEHNFSRDVWSAGEVASDSDYPTVYVHTVFPAMLPEGRPGFCLVLFLSCHFSANGPFS